MPVQVAMARLTAEKRSRSLSSIAFRIVRKASALPQSAFSQTAWRTPSCSLAATRNFARSSWSPVSRDFTIALMSGTVTITVLLSLISASFTASSTAPSPLSIRAARISSYCTIWRFRGKVSLCLKSRNSSLMPLTSFALPNTCAAMPDTESPKLPFCLSSDFFSVRYSKGVTP